MDGHGPTAPGTAAFYVSIGFERNSKGTNITAKASSWYTAGEGEGVERAIDGATRAQAGAVAVAAVAAQAIDLQMADGVDPEQIRAFVDLVNRLGGRLVEATTP